MLKLGARIVSNRLPEYQGEILARADRGVERVARRVQALAMEYVPKKTRTLMRSINVTAPGPLRRVVAPNTPYDRFQETGFHARGGRWVPGRFYMKRAAEAVQRDAARIVAAEMRR